MYAGLKILLYKLLPQKIIFHLEPSLRKLLYLFYAGGSYKCNICSKQIKKFIQLENADMLCPNCGSNARNRRLWEILENDILKENISILHFSPSRNLYRKLKKSTGVNYVSSDLSSNFFADEKYDITKIPVEENSFDLIICYHILEHIPNDLVAMGELYRVLKPGGLAIIQTPFKDWEIFPDKKADTPEKEKNCLVRVIM